MSIRTPQHDEHILHLLIDRATEGLDSARASELDAFLEANPIVDGDAMDLAAASLHLAIDTAPAQPLPKALRDRILTDAGGYFAAAAPGNEFSSRPGASSISPLAKGRRGRGVAAWYLMAASLLLAALGWWQAIALRPASSDLSREFANFVSTAPDAVTASWAGKVEDLQGVAGDVVWSDQTQSGYMRFTGLPPNDPSQMQYQLWIVDPARDENPVDGGVFDVAAQVGEVVVPIDAKLRVDRPMVFALTREKPGGVVVSAGPLAVVASVSS